MSSPSASETTVVVVTGALPLSARAVTAIPDGSTLIAADGGLDHALAAGLAPSILVGDLDSVSAEAMAWAEAHQVEVVRYPADKAATDTELAVSHAATLQPARLILAAGGGDRIDHAVAALGALGAPALDAVASVEAWWGDDELRVIHGPGSIQLEHEAGTTFSVLAMHGACEVTITGARWPLDDHPLGPLVGLGVSNQVADPPVTVTAGKGILTVVVPGMRS